MTPPPDNSKFWGAFEEAGSMIPPHNLASLAAVIRKANHEVKIIDPLPAKLTSEDLIEIIKKENPDFIGISATSRLIISTFKFMDLVKNMNPNIKTVLGGAHITALPEETMEKCKSIDFGVLQEGEITILELMESDAKYDKLIKIDGIIFRHNGKLIKTKPREYIKNLDELPFPAYDLLENVDKYYKPAITNYKRSPTFSIITSRGCFGKCAFCSKAIYGSTCRFFSADYVIRLIKFLIKKYKIKDICFYEDNFLLSRKRVEEICNRIIKEKIDITWSCDARVDQVNYNILKLMKKSGCWEIMYGIESGSQRILDILKKNISLDQIKKAVYMAKKAGINARGFFMIGLPGETEEDIKKTLKFMLELPLDEMYLNYFTPVPGAPLYENYQEYGIFNNPEHFKFYEPNFIPKDLSKDILKKYYKIAYRKFYLRPKQIFFYAKRLLSPKNTLEVIKGFKGFLNVLKGK